MKKNKNGSHSQKMPTISPSRRARCFRVGEKEDWWDELCKAHGAENHWKKESKKNENTEKQ